MCRPTCGSLGLGAEIGGIDFKHRERAAVGHAVGHAIGHAALREQQADAAVLHHVGQALGGVFGVQRHIGAARLQHAQDGDHHLDGALHRNAHQHLGLHAQRDQPVRQAVGAAVQFRKAKRLVGEQQRSGIGLHAGLPLDHAVHRLGLRLAVPIHAPLREPGLLRRAEQLDVADGLMRTIDQRLQDRDIVAGHARHGVGLEQLGRVDQGERELAARPLARFERELELRREIGQHVVLRGDAGQLAERAVVLEQVVEHHLEQRRAAQAALGLQHLHELLEGHILVRLCAQHRVTRLRQHARCPEAAMDRVAQHQRVDEQADHAFGFHAVAVGKRCADADVFLARVAVQQRLEAGQQHHEERGATAVRGLAQPREQARRKLEGVARSAVAGLRLARVVGAQLEHGVRVAELRAPPGQLPLALARCQPLALPQRMVGVLDARRGHAHGIALQLRGVACGQFVDQQLHRGTVGHDVMHHHGKHMHLVGGADQRGAQQRALREVEGLGLEAPRGFVQSGIGFALGAAQVDQRQRHGAARPDPLLHAAIGAGAEDRAQRFVARHQIVERCLQGIDPQRAGQAQRAAHVVGRALGIDLPEEPLALLRVRERQR